MNGSMKMHSLDSFLDDERRVHRKLDVLDEHEEEDLDPAVIQRRVSARSRNIRDNQSRDRGSGGRI